MNDINDVFDMPPAKLISLDALLEGFDEYNPDYLPLNERYRGDTEEELYYHTVVGERE